MMLVEAEEGSLALAGGTLDMVEGQMARSGDLELLVALPSTEACRR